MPALGWSRCAVLRVKLSNAKDRLGQWMSNLEEKEGRKHSQTACPRTCVVTRFLTTVAIIKDGHARIIMRSETILHQRPDAFSQTAYRPTQFFLAVGRQQSVDNPAHCGFATSAEWTLNTWLHFRAAHCPSLDQTRSRGKSAPKSASPSSHVRIGDRLRQT